MTSSLQNSELSLMLHCHITYQKLGSLHGWLMRIFSTKILKQLQDLFSTNRSIACSTKCEERSLCFICLQCDTRFLQQPGSTHILHITSRAARILNRAIVEGFLKETRISLSLFNTNRCHNHRQNLLGNFIKHV